MEDNQRVKEAIEFLIKRKVVRSQKEFCEETDQNISSVSQIVNGKRPVTKRFVETVCRTFPMISKDWLLDGTGQMEIEEPVFESKMLGEIERDKFVEMGADVFAFKLLEMFKKGEIYSAAVIHEKDLMIKNLLIEVGKLQAKLEALENKDN